MSTTAFDPSSYNPPANAQLSKNPQLANTPQGEWADSVYQAQVAQLRAQTLRQYSDILTQLGYKDPTTGAFIPGTVEADALRERQGQEYNIGQADQDVTNQHQQVGTIFSGRLGDDIAKAEHPFVQAIADLDVNVPRQLTALYKQGAGLVDDYTLQQNLYMADAIDRATQRALMQQMYSPGGGGGGPSAPTESPLRDPNSYNPAGTVRPGAYQAIPYQNPTGGPVPYDWFHPDPKKGQTVYPYGGNPWTISGTGTQIGHA